MFYISLGMYYGANMYLKIIVINSGLTQSSIGSFVTNILLVAIGNIIGGGIIIGGSEYYM